MASRMSLELREWMSPSEALEMVANSMGGLAILNGTAVNRLFYWIIRGRVNVLALEVERIEDAPPPRERFGPSVPGADPVRESVKEGILLAHQLPYVQTVVENHMMTLAELNEAARLCGDFPDLWSCSTIEHRLVSQRHPLARVSYTGIRFFAPDIIDRLQIDGLIVDSDRDPKFDVPTINSGAPERVPAFNNDERRQWMKTCGIDNGDKAHKQYKLDPRYDGTKQAAWRKEWKLVHGRGPGRISKIVR